MTIKSQKIILLILVAIAVFGGFEALIYILKLNQIDIYISTALWIYLYLVIKMILLFDLHFKNPGSWRRAKAMHEHLPLFILKWFRVLTHAFWIRLAHFRHWRFFRQSVHGLFIPGVIFWSTVTLFFINFSHAGIKQAYTGLSGLALVLSYWYIKEIFYRRKEKVDSDVFLALTLVKIYALTISYAASLALIRYYCLPGKYFVLAVFALTFLSVHHAIFQHKLVSLKNIAAALAIAAVMAVLGQGILLWWGYHYFTAAVFMSAVYNLMWGTFHYRLDRALTLRAFLELLVIGLLIAGMMFSVTNFKAQILDGCVFGF